MQQCRHKVEIKDMEDWPYFPVKEHSGPQLESELFEALVEALALHERYDRVKAGVRDDREK